MFAVLYTGECFIKIAGLGLCEYWARPAPPRNPFASFRILYQGRHVG